MVQNGVQKSAKRRLKGLNLCYMAVFWPTRRKKMRGCLTEPSHIY